MHKCQPGRRSKKKKVYITYKIPPSSLVLLLAFPFPSWTIIRQQNFPDTRQHYTGRLNCKPTSKEETDRVPQPFSRVASYPANCWVLTRHTHQKYGKLDKIQIPGPHLETHRGICCGVCKSIVEKAPQVIDSQNLDLQDVFKKYPSLYLFRRRMKGKNDFNLTSGILKNSAEDIEQGCQTHFHQGGHISLAVAFKGLNVTSAP